MTTKKSKKNKKSAKIKVTITSQKDNKSFYRIIITSQNKILVCVYKTLYKKSALLAFNKILSENKKKVKFPIRYSSRDHKLIPSKYELLLMKTKTNEDDEAPLLRNEFGKLVPHVSNSNKMVIYQKEEYLFEETFWIYGMNPKSQRKDFDYILNDIIVDDLKVNGLLKARYPVKTILIYKNKLIIEDDDDFEMVICKCENDAARLYTEIKNEISKLKIKCIFFAGFTKGNATTRMETKILDKTGWVITKIRRSSTRP